MRRNWSVRAVLLSAFALGVTAGPTRAGEPQPLPLPAPAPAMSYAPVAGDPVYLPPDAVLPEWRVATLNPQPASLRERVGNCFKKVLIADAPWFCYADHNSVGCGNFCSEFNFIFGSCRTFYGEPCYKGPPPMPVPWGYLYGTWGQGDCRCH